MTEEYKKLKEALRQAPTPKARKQAAEAMRQYQATKSKKRSKPTMVTLSRGGGSSNAVPLDQLPDAMERDPRVYERVRKIVTGEK